MSGIGSKANRIILTEKRCGKNSLKLTMTNDEGLAVRKAVIFIWCVKQEPKEAQRDAPTERMPQLQPSRRHACTSWKAAVTDLICLIFMTADSALNAPDLPDTTDIHHMLKIV